nr:helix-turn-helix domain-containing protein [Liquorilactobacillus satsumensis]
MADRLGGRENLYRRCPVSVVRKYSRVQEFFRAGVSFYPTNEPTSEQLHELVQAGSVIKRQPAQNSASELAVEQIRIRLQHNHYQISKTAADLGISRTTLYRKIKKYGL